MDRPHFQNPVIYSLQNLLAKIVHVAIYSAKSVQFNAIAWFRSWEILKAFDAREFTRRLVIYCSITLAVIASLVVVIRVL